MRHRSALFLLLLVAMPREAAAQDAVALFTQGRALVEKGQWAEACPLFAEAHRLQKEAIGIALNLGDCYAHVGKTASAWSAYREGEFLAKKAGDAERARYAHDKASALEPRLSRIRIVADPTPGLIVHRDDQEVGKGILGTAFPVDPGPHKIEATAPGYLVWSTTLTIGPERDEKTVTIPSLGRAAAGEEGGPSTPFAWTGQRIAGVSVTALGVAGLAVGGVLGVITLKKASDSKAENHCDADLKTCDATGLQLQQSARTTANGSNAAFAAGGAALIAGAIVFATASGNKKSAPASGLHVTVGPVIGAETKGLLLRGGW